MILQSCKFHLLLIVLVVLVKLFVVLFMQEGQEKREEKLEQILQWVLQEMLQEQESEQDYLLNLWLGYLLEQGQLEGLQERYLNYMCQQRRVYNYLDTECIVCLEGQIRTECSLSEAAAEIVVVDQLGFVGQKLQQERGLMREQRQRLKLRLELMQKLGQEVWEGQQQRQEWGEAKLSFDYWFDQYCCWWLGQIYSSSQMLNYCQHWLYWRYQLEGLLWMIDYCWIEWCQFVCCSLLWRLFGYCLFGWYSLDWRSFGCWWCFQRVVRHLNCWVWSWLVVGRRRCC